MTKGIMYSIIMGLIIFSCILGEILYRYRVKKFKKEHPHLKVEYFIGRFDCCITSVGISSAFSAVVLIIIGMISTWYEPL